MTIDIKLVMGFKALLDSRTSMDMFNAINECIDEFEMKKKRDNYFRHCKRHYIFSLSTSCRSGIKSLH